MSASEIRALRKQGRSAEALEMARAQYPQNETDIWFLRAYAWPLYDHASKIVDAYETKELSAATLNRQLSPYMLEFSRMAHPLRKDSAFSQMLRLAGKVSKDWQDFLHFARWAGINDFSDEDKASFVNDQGKTVDSLQKRFTRAICRETEARAAESQSDQELIKWGLGILEQALQDEPNDQWLNYYQSKLHLADGEADLAIKRLVPVLRRQSRAAWPWALLGEILEAARPEDALTCYTHATQLAREEQEVARVRIHLAQRLSLVGRFNEAAQQASLAQKYREKHGYKVPHELQQLLESDWYLQVVASESLQNLSKVEAEAKALLQELDRRNITYTKGVIDHINTERALSYVATTANTGFGLLHRKFPKLAELPAGTLVEVGCAEPEGPPLDWRLSQAKVLPGLCETLSGRLKRNKGKDFAVIRTNEGEIYVPSSLAKAFSPGHQYDVSFLSIKRTDKQGKTGWRVVKFIPQDGLLHAEVL